MGTTERLMKQLSSAKPRVPAEPQKLVAIEQLDSQTMMSLLLMLSKFGFETRPMLRRQGAYLEKMEPSWIEVGCY